jgi:hypothetical protein
MNDPKKPELTSFGKCRQIMRSLDHTINNPEEKQLATAVNPAQLM